jgi:Tfp pilus assembly protein PilV
VIAARLRSEDGFTMIEVLVAAFILVLGAIGVFMTFAAAIHNVQRSRDTQVAQSVAQREIEKIHSLPYERVAMGSPPADSAEAANPASRISGTEYGLKRNGSELAPLVVAGSGVCSSSKPCVNNAASSTCVGGTGTTFSTGTAKGSVYCYDTSQKDAACESATGKSCPYKRVVVAVWLEKNGNQGKRPNYYELQSNVNP